MNVHDRLDAREVQTRAHRGRSGVLLARQKLEHSKSSGFLIGI